MQNVEQVDGAESATVNGDLQRLPVARRAHSRIDSLPVPIPCCIEAFEERDPVAQRVQAGRALSRAGAEASRMRASMAAWSGAGPRAAGVFQSVRCGTSEDERGRAPTKELGMAPR